MASVNAIEATEDVPDRLDSRVWKIVAVSVIASILSQINATTVNVSLASLAVELHSSLTTIQWVTSGYLLALTLVVPINGWLVDRVGARAVFLWCISAFTVTSALCGFSWSPASLIAFRVIQGMSGGFLIPLSILIMVRATGPHFARVAGYASIPFLLAPTCGPILAGALLKYASWRWLFFMNLPIGALALLSTAAFLPRDQMEIRPRELDWVGFVLVSPGLAAFLYGIEHFADAIGLPVAICGALLLAAFISHARRKGDGALLDLELFNIKVFSTAALAQCISNGVTFAGQMLIPLFLINACGRSPTEMGWLMAPLGLGMLCTYPFIGDWTKTLGIRRISTAGALLALLGTLPFLYMTSHGADFAVLAIALFIRGAGQSTVGIPSMSAAYASVDRAHLPMATTLLNVVQRLGGPILTTLCATLLAWQLDAPLPHAALLGPYDVAFLLLIGFHVLLVVAAFRMPDR